MLGEAQAVFLWKVDSTLSPGCLLSPVSWKHHCIGLLGSELQVLREASFDHFWVRMHLSTHMWGGVLHHSQGLEATGIDK